jgi:hypothetical protein
MLRPPFRFAEGSNDKQPRMDTNEREAETDKSNRRLTRVDFQIASSFAGFSRGSVRGSSFLNFNSRSFASIRG